MDHALNQNVAEECLVAPPLVLSLAWENKLLRSCHLRLYNAPMQPPLTKNPEKTSEPSLSPEKISEPSLSPEKTSEPSLSPEKTSEHVFSPEGRMLLKSLQAYSRGQPVVWPDLPLAWNAVRSTFQAHVLRCLLQYAPYGHLLTYAQLAQLAGCPGAARAVGSAMHHNPWALIVPCHRVVGSDYTLHGYATGLPAKATLLSLEGWQLTGNGPKTKILKK